MLGDLLLLTLVLLAVTWWTGTDVSFSMDEPAAILQAQRLADGQGWLVPNPLPGIDPEAAAFYVVLSDRGSDGIAYYAKHPAYPVLLAGADHLGGTTAMVLASVIATVVAAGCAAGIARRIDARLERWSLWAAGVGSPLFFDSQLVIAHTIGAALVGGAALTGTPWERPVVGNRWRTVVSAALLAGACLVRTESALVALAFGAWAAARAVRERSWSWGGPALVWAAVGPAVLALDRWLAGRIVGAQLPGGTVSLRADVGGFLATRMSATATMLTGPGAWSRSGQLALLVVLAGVVGLGFVLRRGPTVAGVLVAGGLSVAGVVVVLLDPVADVVPGILIACPVLTVGLLCWRRPLLDRPVVRALVVITGWFALAVAATQYSQGGGLEWGARYLAIALPLALPCADASVHSAAAGAAPAARRAVVIALVSVSVALAVLAVSSLRRTHDITRTIVEHLEAAVGLAPGADLGDGDRRPIVVTTLQQVGRLTAGTGPPVRGLTALSRADLVAVVERLHAAGVERFVLFSDDPGAIDALRPRYGVLSAGDGPIVVMEAE